MVQMLLLFLRSIREANWNLHLASTRAMLPRIFVYDHINYTRYQFGSCNRCSLRDGKGQARPYEIMRQILRRDFFGLSELMASYTLNSTPPWQSSSSRAWRTDTCETPAETSFKAKRQINEPPALKNESASKLNK